MSLDNVAEEEKMVLKGKREEDARISMGDEVYGQVRALAARCHGLVSQWEFQHRVQQAAKDQYEFMDDSETQVLEDEGTAKGDE